MKGNPINNSSGKLVGTIETVSYPVEVRIMAVKNLNGNSPPYYKLDGTPCTQAVYIKHIEKFTDLHPLEMEYIFNDYIKHIKVLHEITDKLVDPEAIR